MNRRDFCKKTLDLGLFSLATSLLPWRALAQMAEPGATPQFFILMNIPGGWDTSLSTDPWTASTRPNEQDYFLEYRHEELLPFQNSFVGPALMPLTNYFSRMTLINGIFMTANDGGHDSASIYSTTGNGQGDLANFSLELEGRAFQSPFGTLANRSPYAGRQSKTIWDLNDIVASGTVGGADILIDMNDKSTDLSKARQAILSNQMRIQLFNQIMKSYPERSLSTGIASAFRSGLSSSAFFENNISSLDTHASHPQTHLAGLTKSFESLKSLLDTLSTSPGVQANGAALESATLLDQTTILVVSEFCRTPALNGSKGKDHNPQNNSAIIISPRFKSSILGSAGLVTAAQSKSGMPYLAGLPLDINSQTPVRRREDSFIMRPDNVIATISHAMGINPKVISKNFEATRILTSILK